MGCGASSTAERDGVAARPATPESDALKRYRAQRGTRAPGYLTRDPDSLTDYKLLLHKNGAVSSDDDSDCDVLRKARDITVVSNRSSGVASCDASSAVSGRQARSAIRSRRHSPTDSSRTSPSASFLGASSDLKRVSFDNEAPVLAATSIDGDPLIPHAVPSWP